MADGQGAGSGETVADQGPFVTGSPDGDPRAKEAIDEGICGHFPARALFLR